MGKKLTVSEYLAYPESNRPMELVYGYVHEPPSPFGEHQTAVFRIAKILDEYVERLKLGSVYVSPLDVVLDADAGLVVQPDLLFVSAARIQIVRDRVWGAPDLVVEIASPSTAHRDRTIKLEWYRRYGVRECWLVYQGEWRVEVIDLATNDRRVFLGGDAIISRVLPGVSFAVDRCFG